MLICCILHLFGSLSKKTLFYCTYVGRYSYFGPVNHNVTDSVADTPSKFLGSDRAGLEPYLIERRERKEAREEEKKEREREDRKRRDKKQRNNKMKPETKTEKSDKKVSVLNYFVQKIQHIFVNFNKFNFFITCDALLTRQI